MWVRSGINLVQRRVVYVHVHISVFSLLLHHLMHLVDIQNDERAIRVGYRRHTQLFATRNADHDGKVDAAPGEEVGRNPNSLMTSIRTPYEPTDS